jgi:hypothetical protein
MKILLNISFLIGTPILLLFLAFKCEQGKDPYEPGMHFSYSIEYENGFVYKVLEHRKGTIQVLNSDGTPLKCGEKIY